MKHPAGSDGFEARMGRREFIVLISMLMALTALAIDMMLPAFGLMRADFGLAVDSNAVALIVTVFFLGIGLGQLAWGPLADALGRKRVLWLGLGVYIIGAVGGALAPSLEILLLWRFASGIGAAGVRVATFGAVRDRYHGDEMAKTLSYVMAIFILVPMIAPSLGSVVLLVGTWRWVFLFFALAGILLTGSTGTVRSTTIRDGQFSVVMGQGSVPTIGDDNILSGLAASEPTWTNMEPCPAPPPALPMSLIE